MPFVKESQRWIMWLMQNNNSVQTNASEIREKIVVYPSIQLSMIPLVILGHDVTLVEPVFSWKCPL